MKHDPAHSLELNLNGAKVSALNFEGTLFNATRSVGLSTWRGVSLAEGANQFTLIVRDGDGKIVREETRTIHYAFAPTNVSLDERKSRLGADGKTRPVIAVRFTDKDGRAVRQGLSGEFQINEPYQAQDVLDSARARSARWPPRWQTALRSWRRWHCLDRAGADHEDRRSRADLPAQ